MERSRMNAEMVRLEAERAPAEEEERRASDESSTTNGAIAARLRS